MTKREVERIMASIREKKNYAPWSIEVIKVTLKKYFRWVYDLPPQDSLPDVVRWIRGEKPPTNLKKEDLFTPEEMHALVSASPNVMHKTLLSTAYWGALRPGELLTMRIRDVVFNTTEAIILANETK